MYTKKQRESIRGHWFHWRLRFRRDGTVEAQKAAGCGWGVLYTPAQAKSHLAAQGLWKASKTPGIKFTALAMVLLAATAARAQDQRPTEAQCSAVLSRPVDWGHESYVRIVATGMIAGQCMAYKSTMDKATVYAAAASTEQAVRMATYLDRHGEYQKFLDEEDRRAKQRQAAPTSQ